MNSSLPLTVSANAPADKLEPADAAPLAAEAAHAALWDMDGVLIDSGPSHFEGWRRLARERGGDLTYERFRPTFGMRNDQAVLAMFGEVSADESEAIASRKEELFREVIRESLEAKPGVRDLLTGLRAAGFRLAVASSAPKVNVLLVLEILGLGSFFQAIVSGADVVHGKPDPEVFIRGGERLGVPPERCVVFEDAVVGVAAALGAGMRCVAVVGTATPDELQDADLVVGSLAVLSAGDVRRLIDSGRASHCGS